MYYRVFEAAEERLGLGIVVVVVAARPAGPMAGRRQPLAKSNRTVLAAPIGVNDEFVAGVTQR